MAFFCPKTGVRTVAPGISIAAGGDLPAFDGTAEHQAAEDAAVQALAGARSSPAEAPGEAAIATAGRAARALLLQVSEAGAKRPLGDEGDQRVRSGPRADRPKKSKPGDDGSKPEAPAPQGDDEASRPPDPAATESA